MQRGSERTWALICVGPYVVLYKPSDVRTADADVLAKHVLRSCDRLAVTGDDSVGCRSESVTRGDDDGCDEIAGSESVTLHCTVLDHITANDRPVESVEQSAGRLLADVPV